MRGLKLIVHGDDFGLSQNINQGIWEAHCRGILTSTSIMASGKAFAHAIQLARITPTLDVGVHLTLTEERPVLARNEIPTLVDEHGHFHRDARTFITNYGLHRISLDEIRRELDAQIVKVAEHDVRISHLDGHQHLHMVRGIRKVVGDLAKKYDVRAIRFPRERLQGYMLLDRNNWSRLLEMMTLNVFCTVAQTDGVRQPDYFVGFVSGGKLTKEHLANILKHLPATGTCELMCHPGLDDAKSAHAHWGYRWQEELDALTDEAILKYINTKGIDLISYETLARG